jgi:hypothetical protein
MGFEAWTLYDLHHVSFYLLMAFHLADRSLVRWLRDRLSPLCEEKQQFIR